MFTLAQARAAILNKPEFTERDKGSYVVFDYNFSDNKTFHGDDAFQTKILRNLRGTAFDKETGKIIRLGFEKFFNLGEIPDEDAKYDFGLDIEVTQKLDGSCIFPIYEKEGWVLGTRAGVTEISQMATEFIADKQNYKDFITIFGEHGFTPIFEFCSRKNQVVIDYPEDNLVLIGIRDMVFGATFEYHSVKGAAEYAEIPYVKQYHSSDRESLVKWVRSLKEDEGVVVAWPDGRRIKIKADEYVIRHKAVDGLKFEKDVAMLIMSNGVDDVLPIVNDATKDRLVAFQGVFLNAVLHTTRNIVADFVAIQQQAGTDRRAFAELAKQSKYRAFLFSMLDGREGSFQTWVSQNCNTQANYAKVREMLDLGDVVY